MGKKKNIKLAKCVTEWAEIYGLNINTLYSRLRMGWTIQRALETPPKKKNKIK